MLKMLHDYVLIKVDTIAEQVVGSIVVSIGGKDKPSTGIVAAVGPGRVDVRGNLIEHGIVAGDTIVFGSSILVNKLKHDGVEYYVAQAEHIWGINK